MKSHQNSRGPSLHPACVKLRLHLHPQHFLKVFLLHERDRNLQSSLVSFLLLPPSPPLNPAHPPCPTPPPLPGRSVRRNPAVRRPEGLVPRQQRHRDHKRAREAAEPARALPSDAGRQPGPEEQHHQLGGGRERGRGRGRSTLTSGCF